MFPDFNLAAKLFADFKYNPAAGIVAQFKHMDVATTVLAQSSAVSIAQTALSQLATAGLTKLLTEQLGTAALVNNTGASFSRLTSEAAERFVHDVFNTDDDQDLVEERFANLAAAFFEEDLDEDVKLYLERLAENDQLMRTAATSWRLTDRVLSPSGRLMLALLVGYTVGLIYLLGVTTGAELTVETATRITFETVTHGGVSGGLVYKFSSAVRKKLDEMGPPDETKGS